MSHSVTICTPTPPFGGATLRTMARCWAPLGAVKASPTTRVRCPTSMRSASASGDRSPWAWIPPPPFDTTDRPTRPSVRNRPHTSSTKACNCVEVPAVASSRDCWTTSSRKVSSSAIESTPSMACAIALSTAPASTRAARPALDNTASFRRPEETSATWTPRKRIGKHEAMMARTTFWPRRR